jgi:hypothetical protein
MRARVTPLFPIAVSVSRAAECLGVDRAVIDEAVRMGHLIVYQRGLKRRILVEDLVRWVRTTWRNNHVIPRQD